MYILRMLSLKSKDFREKNAASFQNFDGFALRKHQLEGAKISTQNMFNILRLGGLKESAPNIPIHRSSEAQFNCTLPIRSIPFTASLYLFRSRNFWLFLLSVFSYWLDCQYLRQNSRVIPCVCVYFDVCIDIVMYSFFIFTCFRAWITV